MRISTLLAAAVAAVLCGTPAAAQQPTFTDSLLDRFVGRWVLNGTIAHQQTVHDVTAEWVLGHHYLHFHEVSREKDPAGKPQYEADVYIGWDPPANQYVCVWLDVFGGISVESLGHAPRGGDSIPFVFRDPAGAESFHTTFAYDRAHDAWRWSMDNVRNGALSPFARVVLTRQ